MRDPSLSDRKVRIATSLGNIDLELNPEKAPITVDNFLQYVDDKFYDGTIFHRVIEGFVIQGGGFEPGLVQKATRAAIVNEADNGLSNVRGTIAMARLSAPDTATSQFFINHKDNIAGGDGQSDLDPGGVSEDGYAVFGEVIAGLDVVDAIAAVETESRSGFSDVPVEDVLINSIRRLPAD
ncbi:MAG: peptidyl-prolyl cis-trans isomerase [Phycisphaerae bacterium]|nr:peptidyl-prolyl cis-trans isomerase [Phycisphaerae bacterium]